MSGKSRRRGRRLSRSQRRKSGKGFATPAAQPPVVAQKSEPPPRAATRVPAPRASAPKTTLAQPPNVSGELRRIAILGGIMLAVLVVLFLVLPLILD